MHTFGKFMNGAVLSVALLLNSPQSCACGVGGARPGTFGGELRGAYQVQGKVLCVNCSAQEAQKASPTHLHDLYVLKKKDQQAVLQISQLRNTASGRASRLDRWEAITGMTRQLVISAEDSLWRQLTAAENFQKEVLLTGLLYNTGTFVVSELTFLDETAGAGRG